MENSSATLAAMPASTSAANNEDSTSLRTNDIGSPAGSEKCWYDQNGAYVHSGEWAKPPAGATCQIEDMVWGWDGGRYRADDPRQYGSNKRLWRKTVDERLDRLEAMMLKLMGGSIQSPPADGLVTDVPSSDERADDDVPPGLERWLQPGATPEEVRENTKQRLFNLESMREGRIPMSPNEEDEWKALKDSELWLKK